MGETQVGPSEKGCIKNKMKNYHFVIKRGKKKYFVCRGKNIRKNDILSVIKV